MSNSPFAANDLARHRRSSSQILTTVPGDENLTPEERHIYSQLFKAADIDGKGIVLGEEAVEFFKKSGIPAQILSEIWTAADDEQRGFLTQQEFYVALKLIACAQNGQLAAEPVLSTVVALPRFDDIYLEPYQASNNSTPAMGLQLDAIKPDERERFIRMFRSNSSPDGFMEGGHARAIFEKSNLPQDVLNKVWTLANMRRTGSLNQTEFVIAMFYISRVMDHTLDILPTSIPTSIYNSAAGRPGSPTLSRQNTLTSPTVRHNTGSSSAAAFGQAAFTDAFDDSWAVPQEQRTKFKAFFQQLDPRQTGYVSGDDSGNFFRNSGLPQMELEQIWASAAIHDRGRLTLEEFTVAMYLIHERLNGKPIPVSLPRDLVPPSLRSFRSNLSRNNTISTPFTTSPTFSRPTIPTSPTSFHTSISDNMFNNADTLQSAQNTMASQRRTLETKLATMKTQTQTNNIRLEQVRNLYESEARAVRKLESELATEQPDYDRSKAELEQAELQLRELKQQREQYEQRLQSGRDEAEHMKQRVKVIYEECNLIRKRLEQLEKEGKQQGVRLNIGREQVNAAEKEKEKLTQGLPEDGTANVARKEVTHIPFDVNSMKNKTTPTVDTSSLTGSISPTSSTRSPTKSISQPFGDPFAEFTKKFQQQPKQQATLDSMSEFTSHFPDVDKFSAGSPSRGLSPKKDSTIDALKEQNERQKSLSSSVDISDIETKFPDLDTMDKDFPTPSESKSFTFDRPTAPRSVPSTTETKPSLDDPFGTKSSGSAGASAQTSNVFADAFLPKNKDAANQPKPASKYGFDLSEFEVSSSSTPDGSATAAQDDFDTLFGNKPAVAAATTKKKVNFDDAFGSWM